ncbi:MAG: hypothetical protein HQ591_06035 [candidate division Zixibacteria bacterium]|nr:hypothetical protein [Candidatus Tariuqbacter arcticus]
MKKLTLMLTLLIPIAAYSQTGLNARSMGMAGAYQSMSRGAEVARWNPANLMLPHSPNITLDIASFGLSMGNNSINLDFYNDYFSQEYFDEHESWDQQAKDEIISHFDNNFKGFINTQITPFALSYREFAFALNYFAYSNIQLPQNLLQIPLQGIGTEPETFADIEGEAIAGAEIAFSTAKTLHPDWKFLSHFSVGATFKYFIGMSYAKVEHAEATVLSGVDSMAVNGNYQLYLAFPYDDRGKGGDGVGLDLAAAGMAGEKLTLGLTINNLVGSINFGEIEELHGTISLNEPGLNIDELDNMEDYLDSITVTTDTTFISPDIIRYKLPKSFVLSANYRLYPWMVVEADYHQGLNNVAGGTTTPRLALGTEIKYLRFLPLRFGFALGGMQGTTLAAGFGFDFKYYKLDFAVAGQRGLFNGSKGVNFAISQRLVF